MTQHNLLRSVVAGSIATVASLALFATTTHAIEPVIPMPPLVLGEPPVCIPLDPSNLTVLAAQTSPDDWQWRFRIEGDSSGLCNDTITTEMLDLASLVADVQTFTVADVLAENTLGNDYVSTFVTPCDYTTTASFGVVQLDQYTDQHKLAPECLPAFELPIRPELPVVPELPVDPIDPKLPEGEDTPEVTIPTTDPATDPGTPDQGLPRTGNDSTTVMVGLGLLVLGAGLGFTAISMSRRRHVA